MAAEINPVATHSIPSFITAPGETDVLMVVTALFLLVAVVAFGLLFLRLHTLPERIAHRSHKLQFEIVAVLGLLALFTHMHIFWVAGLMLALIDFPDFGNALSRIAGSAEKIAGLKPGEGAELADANESGQPPRTGVTPIPSATKPGDDATMPKPVPARRKELGHA